mmetsp:Transcript_14933/g.17675  ORF Transcript_14933/g.17675 Transcript_14933/m.17675 type:complete len:202 (-) Transcript_14933:89-694(-)
MTTRSNSSLLIPANPFLSCTAQTDPARFCSYSASDSPMQSMTDMPCWMSLRHCPLMYSSDSPKITRRSECPASAHCTPRESSMEVLTAPVNAPLISGHTPSAPTINFPPDASIAVSINTYGTKSATSTLGDASVILLAILVASSMASVLLWGLSFQFPEMNGFRASSCDVRAALSEDGAKAVDTPARVERRVATMQNFIVY